MLLHVVRLISHLVSQVLALFQLNPLTTEKNGLRTFRSLSA